MHHQQCLATSSLVILALCLLQSQIGYGKPINDESYKDTDEIMNEWANSDEYYDDQPAESSGPVISYLPPILVEHIPSAYSPTTTSTSTTTTTTTTRKPVYFPRTEIELGPLFEQVGKARRNEIPDPVDLPVPNIIWAKDPSGQEDGVNYWKKFYNTMYKDD